MGRHVVDKTDASAIKGNQDHKLLIEYEVEARGKLIAKSCWMGLMVNWVEWESEHELKAESMREFKRMIHRSKPRLI